jgi:hypothetical protein
VSTVYIRPKILTGRAFTQSISALMAGLSGGNMLEHFSKPRSAVPSPAQAALFPSCATVSGTVASTFGGGGRLVSLVEIGKLLAVELVARASGVGTLAPVSGTDAGPVVCAGG